ncbi:winged helix-turn-helix domain-containing protein [Spirillospora sp. NPDC029432]|uniref:winged helix-turn-helix domain-containing protein n=1 Tax=Spirillospora sp. NPDC029432 TaxID=3154599 RepID=UPI0034569C98
MRIADELRQDIASGRYAVGETLPSIAKLGERFGAAGATVERALAVLREEGIIMSRQGIPSVVTGAPEHDAAEDAPPEHSEEFTLLWNQLQEISEQLRQQKAKLDELDERTRNF